MASPFAEHGVAAKLALSQIVQALHMASFVGVHCADRKSAEPQVVQGLQACPVPVKPGLHRHSIVPPISAQSASGLQPPFATAQAPIDTQTPAVQVESVPHALSHKPQFALSELTSTHSFPHGTSAVGHEIKVGWAHAARAHTTTAAASPVTRMDTRISEDTLLHSNK